MVFDVIGSAIDKHLDLKVHQNAMKRVCGALYQRQYTGLIFEFYDFRTLDGPDCKGFCCPSLPADSTALFSKRTSLKTNQSSL